MLPTMVVPVRLSSPRVSVPVLSKTTVSIVFIDSRVCPRVGRKPRRRSLTVADVIAVGVASDSAQGQVTTRTESVMSKALSAPASHQPIQTTGARISTRPTNLPAIRSAIMATRGFSDCTRSSTRRMPESRVWVPALTTLTSSGFSPFTLPAWTVSPGWRVSGRYSPVKAASFRVDSPRTISPSTGRVSPGRTRTISPGRILWAGIMSVVSPWTSVATVG